MGRYVIRRLLQMIPVFFGTTLLIFLMVNVMGDPVAGLCGDRQCDPATAARLRAEFGLDKPLWQQYATYMGNVFTGDFGTAFNGQKVTELMGTAFPITIRLTVIAIAFEIVIGITLGVLTGLRRGRPVDTGVLILTLVVISVPTFVTGLLLQLLLLQLLDNADMRQTFRPASAKGERNGGFVRGSGQCGSRRVHGGPPWQRSGIFPLRWHHGALKSRWHRPPGFRQRLPGCCPAAPPARYHGS